MPAPLLLVVTGPPASGKTSAGKALAEELGLAVISKDDLKEVLYDELGSGDDVEEALDRTALTLLFTLAGLQLDAGVSIMLESNFDARVDVGRFRALQDEHGARIVQVWISGETEDLIERFTERAESGDRHPGHGDGPEDAAELRAEIESGRWEALDLPGLLVPGRIEGTDEEIVARVARAIAEPAA